MTASAGPAGRTAARVSRTAVRTFRSHRTIPAVVAAAVLTAISVLAAVEIISALLGRPARIIPYDRVLTWARTTPWNDRSVIIVAAIITALGLLLLLIALIPGRTRYVPLRSHDPDLIIGMRRRSLTRALENAAGRVAGVRDARVRMRGDNVQVLARTTVRDGTGLADAVRRAVSDEIDAIGPARAPHVDVALRRT